MKLAVGHSPDPSTEHAVDDACRKALQDLDAAPTAALVFAAMGYDHAEMLVRLRTRLGDIPLAGCTTDGELSTGEGFQEDSLVLVLFSGVDARVHIASGLSIDSPGAIASMASAMDGATGTAIALPAGISASGTRVVDALATYCPSTLTIVGATAGDQWHFERTFQFFGTDVLDDALVLLHLVDVDASIGVASGWAPCGLPGRVTRVEGNRVHTIDGRPAVEFFRAYFGRAHRPLPQYPLRIENEAGEKLALRAPRRHEEETGCVEFTGDIPPGATVRLADADRSAILEGSAASIDAALDGFEAEAVLVFSCAARKHALGTRTRHEVELLQERVGTLPMAGFYGYGEFLVQGGKPVFHNQTIVSVALRHP